MSTTSRQHGFSFVEIIIVIGVVAIIALIAYGFVSRQGDKATDSPATTQSTTADDVPAAPEVNSTKDLDEASATLDKTDTSSDSDAAELDGQLQTF